MIIAKKMPDDDEEEEAGKEKEHLNDAHFSLFYIMLLLKKEKNWAFTGQELI